MRINWKKTLLVSGDVLLGAYLVLALTAFNKPEGARRICTRLNINIQDEAVNGFISKDEITSRLKRQNLYPVDRQLSAINTRRIEDALKQSAFVNDAECYKTEDGQVCIMLTQRMPTLHVMAANGDDYYLDDNHSIMPNSHYTSNLIVATGNINKWYAKNYLSYLIETIMASDFWSNQIVQVNVLPNRGVELVPRVGNHIVYIGQLPTSKYIAERKQLVNDYANVKLDRLRKFYTYGLSHAGWHKYSYIDVEFDNQIICKKRTNN